MKKFYTLLVGIIFSFGINAQTVAITSGAGGAQGTSGNIIVGQSNYHVSESIYTETEIGGNTTFTSAGTSINKIGYYVSQVGSPATVSTFKIWMKNVPLATTTLAAGTYSTTGYTLVYNGSFTPTNIYPTPNELLLTTSFTRTAGTNLEVMVQRLDGVLNTGYVFLAANGNQTSSTITTARRYNGATAPTGTSSLTASAFRPAIELIHVPPIDANAYDIIAPNVSCYGSLQNLGIVIKNQGTAEIPAGAASINLKIRGPNSFTGTLTNTGAIAPGATETVTFTGINLNNPGTNYDTAIVTITGDGNHSNDTLYATTITSPVLNTFPLVEDAETTPLNVFPYSSKIQIDQAWKLQTGAYGTVENTLDSLIPRAPGKNFFLFDSYNTPEGTQSRLYSKCLNVPSSILGFTTSFWMSHDSLFSDYKDSLYLSVSTDKGVSWTRIQGFGRADATANAYYWKKDSVNLNAYIGQTIQIGFEGISHYGNAFGLDDIKIYNSSFSNCIASHSSFIQSACSTYTWNGTTYSTSGNYIFYYFNNDGCASADTLHLTIANGVKTSTTQKACNSYTWHGTTYTASGNYAFVSGCNVDSLYLTIEYATHNVYSVNTCQSYLWNGINYTTSGDYTYAYVNENGCSSVDTLHLNFIANTITQPSNTTVCNGSNLSFTTEVSSINPITYQWQESADNGLSFYDIFDDGQFIGTNTNILTIANATNILNGRKYRANIFVNGYSGATNSALLTVNDLPVLQLTASANNVCSGASVSLSASGASTYSWTPGNQTGSTITVTPPINTNNPLQPNITTYKVVGTTNLGCVDSTSINITANTIRSIVIQPKNDTVTCSSSAFFNIKISGDFDSLIQWQEKRTPSGNWTNLSNNTFYSGVNKSDLIISTVTDVMNGYQYRAYFTGTCAAAVYSNAATLVVNKINAVVSPNQAKICSGNSQKFEIQNIYEPVKTRTFSSGTLNTSIPDGDYNGFLTDPITVQNIPDTAEIVDVSIKFNIPHTRVGDLDINLLSPNAQVLNLVGSLSNGSGNNTSDNFTNTVISSTSTNSISTASAPRTGIYAAEKRAGYGGQFYQIDNINWSDVTTIINGGWQLAIDDWNIGDTGYLANWSISITYKNPSDHTPATGTWSPITSLYKDSTLLVPYTGSAANVVYVKYPATNINYNVVVQTQNCTTNTTLISVIKALPVTGITTPSDVTVCEGADTVQFVSNPISGTALNYQWQVSIDNGALYSNVVDDGVNYFGANTNTLKIYAYNGGFDGNKYRMIIEACGDTIYSDPSTLNVFANPNAKILIDDATPICNAQPVLLHSSINNVRNAYDGIYQLVFSNYHPIYNTNYDGGSTKVEMRTTGDNSVKIYWPLARLFGNPAILDGGLRYFGIQEPEYIIDPVSNKITVQNSSAYATTFYSMAPDYDSYFDPADNSIYAKWGYNYVNGLFDATTTREWTQQFIYLKPRPTYQYQWKFNGVNITGATDSVYLATIPGLYTLSITTSEGCSFTSAAVDTKIHKEITADGSTLLCNGSSVNISVSSFGNQYQWFKNDTAIAGANDYVYAVTEPGVYYAAFYDNQYGCAVISDSIAIGTIFALSNSPVMTGDNILLSASSIPNATYSWSGPNGYSASTQNPVISNAQLSMSGTYSVTANVSGCSTLTYNVDVAVISPTKIYTFTGNGNWSLATNWGSFLKPPTTLPSGSQIIINPTSNGECILNVTQTISQGASIKVLTGKKFRVPGNLIVQ